MISTFFSIAFKNLRNRKLRSWLTIIGIIISIGSIVGLITISQGLQSSIKEQFDKMGANKIFVMAKGGQPGTVSGLTQKDVDVIKRITEIKYVTPYIMDNSMEVKFGKETIYTNMLGWPSDNTEIWKDYDIKLLKGNYLGKNQKYAAVVGYDIAMDTERFFRKKIKVGNSLVIGGHDFKVVGILDRIGNNEDDSQIYIPLETARQIIGRPDAVSFIEATVKAGKDPEAVAQEARKKLERERKAEDFEVMTPEQILNFLSSILKIVQAVLVSIAAISLVVGAIGIMNSMYTSVTERTKEIGIMKSIGAKNNHILSMFLAESGMIGLVGGGIGTFFGYLIGKAVEAAAANAGFTMLNIKLSITVVVVNLIFAVVISMISGALPAKEASKLDPVDALRWVNQ